MSDANPVPDTIDLKAILARIDRDMAETRKLTEEAAKFSAGQRKLAAEASELRLDRLFVPLLAAATAGGVIVAGLQPVLHARGVLP